MNKQLFLDRLKVHLNGVLSPDQVADNVDYYQNYIETKISGGYSEEEVLSQLGDPRLIAKSIISANTEDNCVRGNQGYEENRPDYSEEPEQNQPYVIHRLPGWLAGVIIAALAIVAVIVVFSLVTALTPLLVLAFAVFLCVKLFRDWLN